MLNKILVFWGLALSAILIVENMVTWMSAFVFIYAGSKAWVLSAVSIIIWILIWYWLKWLLNKDTWLDDDNYDF